MNNTSEQKKKWKINLAEQKKNKSSEKSSDITRVTNYLNSKYEIRRNDVLMRVELRWAKDDSKWFELSDRALDTLLIQLKMDGIATSKNILESLFNSHFVSNYDPFQDYFTSLPPWDGIDHIQKLANTVEVEDSEVWANYLKKWLVGMVRCALEDEVTNQHMLVFYGEQGLGKTRWILNLLPEQLKPYLFTGYTNLEDQVFKIKLGTNLIVFLDELDSYRGHKQAIIKSTITQSFIKVRPLYSNFDMTVKRRASFVAAINHEAFLHDLTGSRRYLVVSCISINPDHNLDMNKLYSQVVHLAKDFSFIHHFTSEDTKKIEVLNERHRIKPYAECLIEKFIEPCYEETEGSQIFTAMEIFEKLRNIKKVNLQTNHYTIGEIMKRKGFKKVSRGSGDKKRWGYLVKIKSTEINNPNYPG